VWTQFDFCGLYIWGGSGGRGGVVRMMNLSELCQPDATISIALGKKKDALKE